MERIKKFLLDDSGSSEAVSSVILIAGAGILLLAAIGAYYGAFGGFFNSAKTHIDGWRFGNATFP